MKKFIKCFYQFESQDRKRFKKWCVDNDYTQQEVATKLGISYSYLQAVVMGDRVVNQELVDKFSKIGFCVRKSKEDKLCSK